MAEEMVVKIFGRENFFSTYLSWKEGIFQTNNEDLNCLFTSFELSTKCLSNSEIAKLFGIYQDAFIRILKS